jgi:hypothetical protein
MPSTYMRSGPAGEYLKKTYAFGSKKSLDKLAVIGGGPKFHKAGPARLYTIEALDEYALAKIGPEQSSTAENVRPEPPPRDPERPRGRPRRAAAGAENERRFADESAA